MVWKITAPITGPHSVPLPPSKTMITMKMLKVVVGNAMSRGSMKPVMLPKIAPEIPRNTAEIAQAVRL